MAASPDLSTVAILSSYRVGYLPPPFGSLAAGELYIEVTPAGGGVPRLWVGTAEPAGFAGNVALAVPQNLATPSVITIDAINNPSPSNAVNITGTVDPGTEVELVALQGDVQVNPFSPWDATSGSFDVTWYLPPGDNYRVRVRMRADPEIFADSNLFAVIP
jgi:hypothetical protein